MPKKSKMLKLKEKLNDNRGMVGFYIGALAFFVGFSLITALQPTEFEARTTRFWSDNCSVTFGEPFTLELRLTGYDNELWDYVTIDASLIADITLDNYDYRYNEHILRKTVWAEDFADRGSHGMRWSGEFGPLQPYLYTLAHPEYFENVDIALLRLEANPIGHTRDPDMTEIHYTTKTIYLAVDLRGTN